MAASGKRIAALNRRHEGTGLGLPLARAMTKLHGATFHIASTPLKGTVIELGFPASRVVPSKNLQACA